MEKLTFENKREKKNKYFELTVLSLMLVIFSIGCAQQKEDQPPAASTNPTPSGTPNTDITTTVINPFTNYSGASVAFTPTSTGAFTNYVYNFVLNNPTNTFANINLKDIGNGRFGGSVSINFLDNGSWHLRTLTSGTGVNVVSYKNAYKGKPTAEFNQWFSWEGATVFHGFFQDQYGAMILVIDGGTNEGDGLGYTTANGSLWYKRFETVRTNNLSTEMCWFIMIGPYSCDTFLNSSGFVQTNLFLYPQDGYEKIGDFWGLDILKGFGI